MGTLFKVLMWSPRERGKPYLVKVTMLDSVYCRAPNGVLTTLLIKIMLFMLSAFILSQNWVGKIALFTMEVRFRKTWDVNIIPLRLIWNDSYRFPEMYLGRVLIRFWEDDAWFTETGTSRKIGLYEPVLRYTISEGWKGCTWEGCNRITKFKKDWEKKVELYVMCGLDTALDWTVVRTFHLWAPLEVELGRSFMYTMRSSTWVYQQRFCCSCKRELEILSWVKSIMKLK